MAASTSIIFAAVDSEGTKKTIAIPNADADVQATDVRALATGIVSNSTNLFSIPITSITSAIIRETTETNVSLS